MTVSSVGLQAQILQLEQRLTDLESQLQGSEQIAPNYLTVDADGTVGASFSGYIQAQGLAMLEQLASGGLQPPSVPSQVQWTRAGAGFVPAWIGAQHVGPPPGGTDIDYLVSQVSSNTWARNLLQAVQNSSGQTALLQVQATSTAQQVFAGAGAQSPTIIDQAGNSNFLQLLSSRALYLDGPFYANVPALASGSTASGTFTSNLSSYAIGALPVGAYSQAGNAYVPTWSYQYNGTNSWTVKFENPFAGGTSAVVWNGWIIGG